MDNNHTTADPISTSAPLLASELFGMKVLRIDPVIRGVMTHKFKVTLLNGEVYAMRFYPPSREKVVDFEPDLLKRYAMAGLPMPEVLTDSRFGPSVGLNYMVYRWIQGVPLDERLPFLKKGFVENIATKLLSYLRQIAQLEVAGYGDLESATRGSFGTWTAFLEATFMEALSCNNNSLDRETITMLQSSLKEIIPMWRELKPVLVWGDVSPENILLDTDDRIIGMIDFEGSLAADFSLSIGYCYARYFNTPFFDALWNIWPKDEGNYLDKAIKFHTILRGLRLVRFAGTRLPTGQARGAVTDILPGFREVIKQLRNQH